MAGIFSFKCSTCGEVHEGSPSFAFRAPDLYLEQPKEVQEAGELSSDLCRYEDEDGMHYFILVCGVVALVGIGLFEILGRAREKSFLESVFNFGLIAVVTAHCARIAITGRAARGWLPWQ